MKTKLGVKTNKVSNSGKPQQLPDAKQLQELGFKWLSEETDMRRRFAIAYEHYRRMNELTYHNEGLAAQFEVVEIEKWDSDVPPSYVLSALKRAIERECFKSFVIYTKENDPILMGIVAYGWKWQRPFVIAHWGNDVDLDWLEKNTR